MVYLGQIFKNRPNGLGLIVDRRPDLHGRVVNLRHIGGVNSVRAVELSADNAEEG